MCHADLISDQTPCLPPQIKLLVIQSCTIRLVPLNFLCSTELGKFMGKNLNVARSDGGAEDAPQRNKKCDVIHALPYPTP